MSTIQTSCEGQCSFLKFKQVLEIQTGARRGTLGPSHLEALRDLAIDSLV